MTRHRAHDDGQMSAPEAAAAVARVSTAPPVPLWVTAAIVAGWILVGTTIVVAALDESTQHWLDAGGAYPDGTRENPFQTAALLLALATGLFAPWLSGLAATPDLAWREDGDLLVVSSLGRRRVAVRGALVVRLRIIGRGEIVHAALVIDRRLRAVLLMSVFPGESAHPIRLLLGRRAPETPGRVVLSYVLGAVWLAAVAVSALLLMALVAALTGLVG